MNRVCSIVFTLLLLVSTSGAGAVVPNVDAIVARATTQERASVAFVVNYVEASDAGRSLVALRVASDGQGLARLDVQFLTEDRTESSVFATTPKAEGVQSIDRAPLWLQWWMGRALPELVIAAGIDQTRTSLAHADGTILWVLGAGPRQGDVPQLQFERDTGLLRRVVQRNKPSATEEQVSPASLDAYPSAEGVPTRFPGRLTMRIGGRDVTLVNTWTRLGEAAGVTPEEFAPPVAR